MSKTAAATNGKRGDKSIGRERGERGGGQGEGNERKEQKRERERERRRLGGKTGE